MATCDMWQSYACLLHPEKVSKLVSFWLAEDTPSFDYGGFVVGDVMENAVLLCKSDGVLCGRPFFDAIFQKLNCNVTWMFEEGTRFSSDVVPVATVSGKAKDILLGERVALNCLSRASGIASFARRMRDVQDAVGWKGEIAGTRKTNPGFRLVEKYALLVGGCSTHRYDLSSMVMLKDNHIWSTGSIGGAVSKARKACGFSLKIEVECRSVQDALEACNAGADVVMLDNFDASVCENAASTIKSAFPHALVEVSGGISSTNIASYMLPSVDVISLGSLTHGYKKVDFSLKIVKEGHDPSNPTVR